MKLLVKTTSKFTVNNHPFEDIICMPIDMGGKLQFPERPALIGSLTPPPYENGSQMR